MKLLEFLRELADSDEEFIAIIIEMNQWLNGENDEKKHSRSLYAINNIGRFNFSRDEYKQAIDKATKALQNQKSNKYYRRSFTIDRTNQSSCDTALFW